MTMEPDLDVEVPDEPGGIAARLCEKVKTGAGSPG
jgi:hypothetical protein